jgi:hypothetical protein
VSVDTVKLTGGIILIRKVRAVLRARSEETPEGTATLALAKTMQVYMPREAAFHKGLSEVLLVDAVTIEVAYQHGKVDMPIWSGSVSSYFLHIQ